MTHKDEYNATIAAPPHYRLLVVEDNPDDRLTYRRFLKQSGHAFEITEIDTMHDALEQIRLAEFDCILLDYRLPDASGIELIKFCKENNLHENGAIVMVTGQGDEQTAVEAMKLGALDYLAKDTITDGYFAQNVLNAIERAALKNEVREYRAALEKSYHALSEFTHTVSHDLKAPLRRIRQYCELLNEEAGNQLNENALRYIDRLGVSASRMQSLIDDLLIYSRTLYAEEQKSEANLHDLLGEVLDALKPTIEEHQANITIGDLPTLPIFPVRMKELFQNLIENAMKYRSEKTPAITITAQDEGDHYLISVSDNSLGIDPQFHENIFREFERLHTQEEIEGTGLGLSICKKVVEMHGGKIWVESQIGQGSTFYFTLFKR